MLPRRYAARYAAADALCYRDAAAHDVVYAAAQVVR